MSHPFVTSVVLAIGLTVPGFAAAAAPATSVAAEPRAVGTAASVVASSPAPVTVTQMDLAVAAEPTTGPAPAAVATPGPTASVAPTDDGTLVATAVPGSDRVVTPAVTTGDVQTVGLTWPQGADGSALATQLRTRTDGRWSDWSAVPAADDAPDPGTADAVAARSGTDDIYIGDVDAVQLSFAATAAPRDTKVALVGSTAASNPTAAGAVYRTGSSTTEAVSMTTGVSAPTVIPRAVWGAAPAVCRSDVASSLVGAVLHHTADRNTYASQAEVMQMIRNDQAYHINTRGWCDIGYNFVVDKWGNVYEGRANSLTQAVIGVHAGGFNTGTVGVAMLGTYDAVPPAVVIDVVGRLIGYRLGAYGVDPSSSMRYTTGNGENSRFHDTTVTLPRVMGHRDVAYTDCPGGGGYAALPAIRAIASRSAAAVDYAAVATTVTAIYHDMLDRGPDVAGLPYWSGVAILAGSGAVANSFARSPEYIGGLVVRGYDKMLGRDPAPADIQYWTAAITSGAVRPEVLRGYLAQGDEYWNRAGGTPDGFVTQLYEDVLGRSPSASELAYWTGVLASTGRGNVAVNGIWRSTESGGIRVAADYDQLLGRGTDPQGRDYWAAVWVATGDDTLRAGIVNSQEYLDRSNRLYG